MMASRWAHSCEDNLERQQARSSFCENDSAEWRGMDPREEESFSWPRPKTVLLRRTSHGFGFTLRHFIVYPPESSMRYFLGEDVGRRGRQRNRLEPMDTIFVKQVKEGGPAHGAGLCTGDRIVKVNGASIIGKAYCEVISLIQDSGDFLELCVMPKDEDILQLPFSLETTNLAYSQDAYLRGGHNSYSGNACHIPGPPPVCYPRVDCKPAGMSQATDSLGPGIRGSAAAPSDHGYRKEITVPPSLSTKSYPKSQMAVCMRNESVRTVVVPPDHMGRMGSAHRIDYMDPAFVRVRPASLAQYPHPRKADVYPGGPGLAPYRGPTHHYPASQPNIDWRTYQTYREYIDNKGIHSHGSRTIQERLDCLRSSNQNAFETSHHIPQMGWGPKGIRRRSTSHERSYRRPPPHFQVAPRSVSQDRVISSERISHPRNWAPRSVSQDGPMHKGRSHSTDYVDPTEITQPNERTGYRRADPGTRPTRQSMPRQAMLSRPSVGYSNGQRGPHNPSMYTKGPDSLQTHPPPNLSDRPIHFGKIPSGDEKAFVKANHAGHANHQSRNRVRAESVQPVVTEKDVASVGKRSSSCSTQKPMPHRSGILKPSHEESRSHVTGRSLSESGVVLRPKPPGGKHPSPLRHPSYILAVNDDDDDGADSTADVAACWLPNDARREMHIRRLEERHTSCSSNPDESLDSIPFIDEPVSPSVDRNAAPIPPSAVISVPPSVATGPSSPDSPCPPIRRQLSHDQESLRSALLDSESASQTERSKSYDEGLDNYQEEGRGRSSGRHMSGFRGLKKALDGHKPSGDSGSRRDSSADVFSDSSKEGLLTFRQLCTDKNKRVSGGMKSWKQVYAVLQGHTLTLFRDRKDAVLHLTALPDEEPLRISVKACLIDISYSDTRRKNVLRLTTSDSEYLFQAEGREEMLTWIKVIQENSNPDEEDAAVTSQDLISRKIKEYNMMSSAPSSKSEPSPKTPRQSLSIKQAFLGGKTESKSPHSPKSEERRALRDEASPPRDRGAWKIGIPGIMRKPFEKKTPAGVTFGVRLDDCPPAQNNRFVPLIVEVCCHVVEDRGLEYTGIYRVPGNNAAISNMQEELNTKGIADIDVQEDKWRDLNVISSLLKSFFRKLPDPLFTNEKYADFIEANRTDDSVERLKQLKRLIRQLPDHHYETLKFLCAHLKRVSDNCEKNKMEPRNLAIVFGPTLVRTSEDNMTNMVNHMPDQCKIVENLIQQYDWFFTEDCDEDPVTTAEQERTVQSQPVPNIDHLLSNIGRTTVSPGEVSDSACSDSSKSKSLWASGKDQCSKEMLRSSFFVSRKRKKPKDKAQPSSSDDDLDAFPRKEMPGEGQQQPPWSSESRTEEEDGTSEEQQPRISSEEQLDKTVGTEAPTELKPASRGAGSPDTSPSHSPSLNCHAVASDPPSNYEDTVSDLGTMNSTSSRASVPRPRRCRTAAPGHDPGASGPGAEVCSITSDYSTTSSMTFMTGGELNTLSPEVRSVAESRGGDDDADDERSELFSEGRPTETDSESDISVFAVARDAAAAHREPREAPRPLSSHRLIDCDTLSRKKAARQKTDSESSLDGSRSDKDSNRQLSGKGRSTGSLSSSSRGELDKAEPAWKLKITDRLKVRLRVSVDDMFGVGSQRNAEGRSKKKNIRRRHTMGGQRDFAELSVLGDWPQEALCPGSPSELSAVDRLRPKCSSQDFSIGDWIARERHRTSNPEVSLDPADQQGAPCGGSNPLGLDAPPPSDLSHRAAESLNGDMPHPKSLSLSATAHPHKLASSQVVHSRFYQYL